MPSKGGKKKYEVRKIRLLLNAVVFVMRVSNADSEEQKSKVNRVCSGIRNTPNTDHTSVCKTTWIS